MICKIVPLLDRFDDIDHAATIEYRYCESCGPIDGAYQPVTEKSVNARIKRITGTHRKTEIDRNRKGNLPVFCVKNATLGRTHIGIYTVLNESFSPQEELLVLKYIKYSCALQPSP